MTRSILFATATTLALHVGCGGMHEETMQAGHERAATLGVDPPSVPSLSLVTLECGDGDPLHITADVETIEKLQGAVQAMMENPAGLVCSLSTAPLPAPTVTTNPTGSTTNDDDDGGSCGNEEHFRHPYVFGAGEYRASVLGGCLVHFNLKAKVNRSGPHGIQKVRLAEQQPVDAPAYCSQGGELKANVTCVDVVDNTAEIRGIISEGTGLFAARVGEVLVTGVIDNGRPSTTNRDLIRQNTATNIPGAGLETACVAGDMTNGHAYDPVLKGNITVRQRGSHY
jgi:hypothetical protein